MTTLVTGANGFIGSALCTCLGKKGAAVRAAVRTLNLYPNSGEAVEIKSLSSETDGTVLLRGVNHVVHLAARVHVMNDKVPTLLRSFARSMSTQQFI